MPRPALSLDRICALALEAQIYKECVRYYPFVLGAQPVRPIDLAASMPPIANEGARPTPYAIESIEQQWQRGLPAQRRRWSRSARPTGSRSISSRPCCRASCSAAPRAASRSLAPYVAGKTGTTDDENDAWFVGFTNDVTVAVWVGYDNADGKRRTLGGGADRRQRRGPDLRADHAGGLGAPRRRRRRSRRRRRRRGATSWPAGSISKSGEDNANEPNGTPRSLVEYFRRDRNGGVADTQYRARLARRGLRDL